MKQFQNDGFATTLVVENLKTASSLTEIIIFSPNTLQMKFKNISFYLSLMIMSLLAVSCDKTEKSEALAAAPEGIAVDAPLFGLSSYHTTLDVGTFSSGLPIVNLEAKAYESMFHKMAKTITSEAGELVNYYLEQVETEEGNLYYMILKGELSDGSFLSIGLNLLIDSNTIVKDGEAESFILAINPEPTPHWSCRSFGVCNTCQYDFTPNSSGCKCSFGPNTCQKYYPGQGTE